MKIFILTILTLATLTSTAADIVPNSVIIRPNLDVSIYELKGGSVTTVKNENSPLIQGQLILNLVVEGNTCHSNNNTLHYEAEPLDPKNFKSAKKLKIKVIANAQPGVCLQYGKPTLIQVRINFITLKPNTDFYQIELSNGNLITLKVNISAYGEARLSRQ